MDFVASLDSEISRLEKAIEDLPEVRQLKELRRVRALYPQPAAQLVEVRNMPRPSANISFPVVGRGVVVTVGRKMAPERLQALDIVRASLENQSLPIKTVDLLDHIRAKGIDLGGNDPVNSLSALLSTSGQFQAHGRSGWTLKSEAQNAAEQKQKDLAEIFGADDEPSNQN
jgi:hypothetical protein